MEHNIAMKHSTNNDERTNDIMCHSIDENTNHIKEVEQEELHSTSFKLHANPLKNKPFTVKYYTPYKQRITFLNLPDKYNCVDVIANSDLFKYIMTFANGLPIDVINFKKKHCQIDMEAYKNGTNIVDDYYYGILHRAIEMNNINIAKKVWQLWKFERIGFEYEINEDYGLHGDFKPVRGMKLDNYVEIIQWMLENKIFQVPIEILNSAAMDGSMKIIKLLHEHIGLPTLIEQDTHNTITQPMYNATMRGHLSIVEYFHNLNLPCDNHIMDCAAEYGHLHVVKFLSENCTEGCTEYAMDSAARNGHTKIVKYLVQYRTEGCTEKALKSAVDKNYFEIVGELLTLNREWSTLNDNILRTVRRNNPQMMKLLMDAIIINNEKLAIWRQAMEVATRESHSSNFKILLEVEIVDEAFTDVRNDTLTFAARLAAKLGFLDIIKLLLADSRSLSNNPVTRKAEQSSQIQIVLNEAASHGHAGLVMYVRAKYFGDNWSDDDIHFARTFSHDLEKISFDIQMDVTEDDDNPMNIDALDRAVFTGNVEIVKLMYEYGAKSVSTYAMGNAVRNGNVDIVKFLNEIKLWDLDIPIFMNAAAEVGQLDIVKCLHEFGAACTDRALIEAARNGHLNVTQFLHENRYKGEESVVKAFEGAVLKGKAEIIEYLLNFVNPENCAFELSVAAMHGHLEIVKQIINTNVVNKRALKKALTCATMAGNFEIVKILHQQYEKRNKDSITGQNNLYQTWQWSSGLVNTVLEKKYYDIAKFIFQTAGNTELNLEAMLMMACELGDLEWTKGIWQIEKCKNGKEAMHAATIQGHVELATFLLNEIRLSDDNQRGNINTISLNNAQASFSIGTIENKKLTIGGKVPGGGKRLAGHRRRK